MPKEANNKTCLFDFGSQAHDYDRWYDTPAGQAHDRIQKADVKVLLEPASARETLLDIGCGTGHWSSFFASIGYMVTGIDISPEMIEVAKQTVPDCSFHVGDACDLPFDDESFHVVASMATLEFVSDPFTMVREMARCCRKPGTLLVGTLNRLAPLNQRRLLKNEEPYASGHLLAPAELQKLLASYGDVRMVASARQKQETQQQLARQNSSPSTVSQRRLFGPFIVAEVKL